MLKDWKKFDLDIKITSQPYSPPPIFFKSVWTKDTLEHDPVGSHAKVSVPGE